MYINSGITSFFSSSLSSTDINDCLNRTCDNGGTCRDGVNSYSCNCLAGFTGHHCEIGRLLLSLLLVLTVVHI